MKNEIFEMHLDSMEEDYKLALQEQVVCQHCGETKPAQQTLTSVTEGTICFKCMCNK